MKTNLGSQDAAGRAHLTNDHRAPGVSKGFPHTFERQRLLAALFAGLAVTSKYSAIPYLGGALVAYAVLAIVQRRALPQFRQLLVMGAVLSCSCWGVFGFHLETMFDDAHRPYGSIDPFVGETGIMYDPTYLLGENVPLPLRDMVRGLGVLAEHAGDGHHAFLLGDRSMYGWPH